jgi:hypothetical protein
MKIPGLCFLLLLLVPNCYAGSIVYETINCYVDVTMISMNVPMLDTWTEERKELEAQKICGTFAYYEDSQQIPGNSDTIYTTGASVITETNE